MYEQISTTKDTLKEKYIRGAELVGKYGFPQLKPVQANVEDLKPVPFHEAKKEKNPRQAVAHCFLNDEHFSRLWNDADKHIDYLKNFKYVLGLDFSIYSDMSLALQIYNVYRNRALEFYLSAWGVHIVPAVSWSDESSFEWCFDGLPKRSALATSTNGCHFPAGREAFRGGVREMVRRLEPTRLIIVGKPIDIDVEVDIQYLKSFGQQMTERLKGAV